MGNENKLVKNRKPEGILQAAFAGYDSEGLCIRIEAQEMAGDLRLALYDGADEWRSYDKIALAETEAGWQFTVPTELIEQLPCDHEIEWRICLEVSEGDKKTSYYLHNDEIQISDICREEMYDRRSLYEKSVQISDSERYLLPHYLTGALLAVSVAEKFAIYTGQMRNEIYYETKSTNSAGTVLCLKCFDADGSYLGILSEEDMKKENPESLVLPYQEYEKKCGYIYMQFETVQMPKKPVIVWKRNEQLYYAPIQKAKRQRMAEVFAWEIQGTDLKLRIQFSQDVAERMKAAQLTAIKEEWEKENTFKVEMDEGVQTEKYFEIGCTVDITPLLDTEDKWNLCFTLQDGEQEEVLYAETRKHTGYLKDTLLKQCMFAEGDTRYQVIFGIEQNRLTLMRKYGHNALFKKNRQNVEMLLANAKEPSLQEMNASEVTLQEFLAMDGINPRGEMYGRMEQTQEGSVTISLYQQMGEVIEAELVMFHSQGMGILATQTLEVTDGILDCFTMEIPDIDAAGKIEKPTNAVWFRIALAVRTNAAIYFTFLRHYDIDTNVEREGSIHDTRSLYLAPMGERDICGIAMSAVPYYAMNQLLSMKYVRPDQVYRSQCTNELLDLRIKRDTLIVKMRCRDCGGTYKGIILEYRKVKEDDAETYLIPYESLTPDGDWWIMVTRVDLKKYYLRMLYWDIRCAFEKDGKIYTLTCHSNDKKFLHKYKNVFVDRTYPNENSIMFPYATANSSVALMHRETCPQDHWQFRFKEKVALILYKRFKNYWDQKNIYLIFEKYCTMAQDNGYFFFKYCMDAEAEKTFDGSIYYVLDRKAADWEKVMPYKDHVIKYLSLKHMIYLQACKLMISTDTKGHAYVWRSMGSDIKSASYQKKLVFLQHGVTAFKRGHFEKGTNVGCEMFITTSEFEHDIIRDYLGYDNNEIPITGFARWDVLRDKSEGHREILMMPTWRTWLDDAENEVFAQSDYCRNYMALLNNPKLDEILREYDVTLNFYLHPKFRKFITEFSAVSDHIRLIPFGEEPLNELMMQCNLLITDFSSVAWDVYYMNKPVLFYHFDIDAASQTLGFYMDMKNDVFGDRAEEPDELMALITEYIQNGFQMKEEYAAERERYFAYVDDCNSERIWKAIQETDWEK